MSKLLFHHRKELEKLPSKKVIKSSFKVPTLLIKELKNYLQVLSVFFCGYKFKTLIFKKIQTPP